MRRNLKNGLNLTAKNTANTKPGSLVSWFIGKVNAGTISAKNYFFLCALCVLGG